MPATRRIRSLPPSDLPSLTAASSECSRVLRAELRCYLCAETCGALEAPPAASMPPVARFHPADGSADRMLAWHALRCPRCGGRSLFLDEPQTLVRRSERIDWTLEQPRRGRPPRWLVALREPRDAA